jgi:WD40 repeat protein
MRCPLLLSVLVAGCATLPKTPSAALDALKARPTSHLEGTVSALGKGLVLNREDFVWDAKTSPDSKAVAFLRMGMKSFHLALFDLAAPKQARFDVVVNPHEFNVEALEFSADGALVAAISRDRTVRLFDVSTGALKGAWLTDEPLSTLAFDPRGGLLVVGSAKGLLTVLTVPDLGFVAEQRGHADEVTGLAWATAGELFSSSWDRSVSVWTVNDGAQVTNQSRVRFEKKAGVPVIRGVVDGKASAAFVLDARAPMVIIRSALAQTLGLDVLSLIDEITLQTAMGAQVARVAKGKTLAFKGLTVKNVDLAICDACVPQDATAVLGKSFTDRIDIVTDQATDELVLTARADAVDVSSTSPRLLARARRWVFQGSVNDVTVDAKGAVLGLALSELKAQRTKDVYDREKRREVEPEREWDCAARVDAKTGLVLEQLRGHRGVVVSGGWDREVRLHRPGGDQVERFGWAVRRVRFSRDGSVVTVAAWTPQNPLGDHQSDPAAVVYEAVVPEPAVVP